MVENSLPWRFIFEGVRGSNGSSILAIDDITLSPSACVPIGECDFEGDSMCSYENDILNIGNWDIATARDLKAVR